MERGRVERMSASNIGSLLPAPPPGHENYHMPYKPQVQRIFLTSTLVPILPGHWITNRVLQRFPKTFKVHIKTSWHEVKSACMHRQGRDMDGPILAVED